MNKQENDRMIRQYLSQLFLPTVNKRMVRSVEELSMEISLSSRNTFRYFS